MKFYSIIIKYRLYIGLALIAIGVLTNIYAGFWPAFLPYLIGLVLIAGHFFFGPLRLIQEHMEAGDMEGAEKVIATIKFPNLLYKPIRSVYFTLKGNIAMMKNDFPPEVRSINVFQKIKVDRKVAAERYQREIDEIYSLSAEGDWQ